MKFPKIFSFLNKEKDKSLDTEIEKIIDTHLEKIRKLRTTAVRTALHYDLYRTWNNFYGGLMWREEK